MTKLALILSFLLCFHISAGGASNKYLELVDSADYLIAQEKWDLAEATIIEALKLEPANFTNSLLFSNLGIVQNEKGEFEKAIESFSLGLSIAPSSSVIYNNRAKTFLALEKYNKVKNDLLSSLRIDSIQEWPLQTLGFLFIRENQIDSAKLIFKRLNNHFPSNSLVYSGNARIAQIEGDNQKALKNYETALKMNPEDMETNYAYILLLIEMDKYTEAKTTINKSISKYPEDAMYYLLRGYLHKLNYRMDESQADRKIAIDKGLEPEYVDLFIPPRRK